MNIRITHNWLLEYLDTDATPLEIQKYLSLCGPSVESVEKTEDGDYVYEIEITSNRIDSASVFGIALECQAILPMFGKKAKLILNPLEKYRFVNVETRHDSSLRVTIQNPSLCSRFSAVVLDEVKTKPSPDFIQKRLRAIGIKVINNVVDISNYLMVSFGQPTHVFDFDKIGKHTMYMRESTKGELLITLDEKKVELPGGDIVIQDGNGELIDLCGIMGGLNSSFTNKTKRVLLFVQTYNKQLIRRTSMLTGQRTIAATYFEKGLDEERVEVTLAYGVELLESCAGAKVASEVTDIQSKKYSPRTISFTLPELNYKIGVEIDPKQIHHILTSLGFGVRSSGSKYVVTVPSFRQYDVEILEDIVEEVARIYGYHNLPNHLSPATYVKQPKAIEDLFVYQNKIKTYLKHIGLNEVLNYSMISLEMIEGLDLKPEKHLFLSNVMSEEIKYLRTSLLPSLIKNIKTNEGRKDTLKLFELAKVYQKREGDLPEEKYKLGIAVTTSYEDLKGIVEALLQELHIEETVFELSSDRIYSSTQSTLVIKRKAVGTLGKLKTEYKEKNVLSSECYLAELDFQEIISHARTISTYYPLHPYAIIKLDHTVIFNNKSSYEMFKEKAFKHSELLQKMEVIDRFKNKITLRMYFSSHTHNITEEEAKKELEACTR